MNRYTVAGIVGDLAAGRRVLVVCETVRSSRVALEEVAAAAIREDLDDDLAVRRTNGCERITLPNGGVAFFRSRRQGAHGMSADVLVTDHDPTLDELAGLLPALATSPSPEWVRP